MYDMKYYTRRIKALRIILISLIALTIIIAISIFGLISNAIFNIIVQYEIYKHIGILLINIITGPLSIILLGAVCNECSEEIDKCKNYFYDLLLTKNNNSL
jgi:hypothetical protein